MLERANLGHPIEDPRTHRMIGGVRIEDSAKYIFFDSALRGRWSSILQAFEGERVQLTSASVANKKVELVTLKKEDHWPSRRETRLQMLKSSMAFIEANNPPD